MYGDASHVTIPWSALSTKCRRALRSALGNTGLESEFALGFSIFDLRSISIQNLLDVRHIGLSTVEKLILEIQRALDTMRANPDAFYPKEVFWDIPVGAKLARKELHDRFGGVREGGISPVGTKSRNIMIFSHPKASAEHGYEPDVWLDDDTFLYCGEGPTGDQEMSRYNKSILQHAEADKVLRVFDGTRGEVTYRGAFALDTDTPWFFKPSIGLDGKPRKVIMFRMIRIDATVQDDDSQSDSENAFYWTCKNHKTGGNAQTLEETEFLATTHMQFGDNPNGECEIGILSPGENNFQELDNGELELRQRNREMLKLRTTGMSLKEIGDTYGLTRERVRQVLKKAGGPTRQDLKELRAAISADNLEAIKKASIELAIRNPKLTVAEAAHQLGISSSELTRALSKKELNNFAKPPRAITLKWTDEQIIQVLQEAATLEFPLTVAAYSKLIEEGFLKGPSAARICQRFKSWQVACDLAGVEAGRRTRPLDLSRWTNEDLIDAVITYLKLPHSTGSANDYEYWASGQDDVPSLGTLRNRLGTWNEVRNEALERLRNEQ